MTCRGCGGDWGGLKACHCAACHQSFSTVGNFDAHRDNGTCLDPASVTKRDGSARFRLAERARGAVWVEARDFPGEPGGDDLGAAFSGSAGGRAT